MGVESTIFSLNESNRRARMVMEEIARTIKPFYDRCHLIKETEEGKRRIRNFHERSKYKFMSEETVTIKKKDLLEAYRKTDSENQALLRDLYPDVLREYSNDKLYVLTHPKEIAKRMVVRTNGGWNVLVIELNIPHLYSYSDFSELKGLMDYFTDRNWTVEEFSGWKDYINSQERA